MFLDTDICFRSAYIFHTRVDPGTMSHTKDPEDVPSCQHDEGVNGKHDVLTVPVTRHSVIRKKVISLFIH
jgi:hypothetical protein